MSEIITPYASAVITELKAELEQAQGYARIWKRLAKVNHDKLEYAVRDREDMQRQIAKLVMRVKELEEAI